ncbi:fimbrial protein [Pantoea anthophila]|nr:fimbrial protein [Pantoea anthophila]WIM54740.1 fimbrial protein [Pantoea anthophila]
MNMKKIAFLTASVVSALLASQAFAVSNNTITFQGLVTGETCTVTVNGNTAKPLVLLPTISTSALSNGNVAGKTTFDIGVTGCTGSDTDATTISTQLTGNNVTKAGNLGNLATVDAAENVEIQIVSNKDDKVITFGEGTSYIGQGHLTLDAKVKNASATYTAQYVAVEKDAVAGAVEATMQYAIIYK